MQVREIERDRASESEGVSDGAREGGRESETEGSSVIEREGEITQKQQPRIK
jgi:hypothetical protein